MTVMFTDYASNVYDNEREAVALFHTQFNKVPTRAVFQRVTKRFCKKFLALFDLEVLFQDFGFFPSRTKNLDKRVFIDQGREALILEYITGRSICYALHVAHTEANLALIEAAIALSKKHQVRPAKEITQPMIELVITSQGQLTTTRRKFAFQPLTDDELKIHYGKDFLSVYEKLKEFLDTHRKLVLLHGPPGTGKSTLIKQLIASRNEHLLYFSPENVRLLGTPDFTKFLLEHTGKVILAEDAENILVDTGTRSSATANLLNLTDGVLAEIYDCGLLATFNTHISNLDSALVRPGRLFMQHELRALDKEESNIFLEYKKSPLRVEQGHTLAELFSMVGE